MQPLIYLDFDGVVCTPRAQTGQIHLRTIDSRADDDPVAFGIVRRIAEEADALIVVSSSKRIIPEQRAFCLAMFEKYGLADRVHPDPFTGKRNSRSREIAEHLAAAGNPTYIILDDERFDFTSEQLQRLVHCDMMFGIGPQDYLRALRLLGGGEFDEFAERDESKAYQTPRLTLANTARQALTALQAGETDKVATLLEAIASHDLAQ